MKPLPSSENDEQNQEIIKLLKGLRSFDSQYPPELLSARRAAFLAQIEQLGNVEVEEELTPGDQEIVKLLASLKSTTADYPPNLLAARRSAFLQQIGQAGTISLWDKFRGSITSIFQDKARVPTVLRTSLVVASLMAAVFIGALLFSRIEKLSPSRVVEPARTLSTGTYELASFLCGPDDQSPPCSQLKPEPSQDLADPKNGLARPAVSSEVGSHKPASVNDGRTGTSWVSNRADGWVKIDLGKVTTINSVSLRKGNISSSDDNHLGQFVIAVALSDTYADGNSNNDYTEYAQVFNSEQTGFSGMVSQAETVRTLFPAVKARFVKITFKKAGAAIDDVGVFMVQPPAPAEQPTGNPQDDVPGVALTPVFTNTLLPMDTATPLPTNTQLPTETGTPFPTGTRLATETLTPRATDTELPTNTAIPILTDTSLPSETPIPLVENTLPPADTATLVPTRSLPSNTPMPSSTAVPPTAIPPTAQPLPASAEPIIITGNDQNLTFICNGNAVELRGHANTVTLLGPCSSITVTGNGNLVLWQSGSPVITNKGNDNIISQK